MTTREPAHSRFSRGARLLLALLTVVASVLCVAGPAAAAPARRASGTRAAAIADPHPVIDGITTTATSTYVVDPGAGAVHVTVAATLTNVTPPSGGGYTYLPTFSIGLVKEATAVSARHDDGSPLSVRTHPTSSKYIDAATITLSPALYFGSTQKVVLTYDIPSLPPRQPGASTVNAAYVSFPVFPSGDPGATDVEVDIPSTWQLETSGSTLDVEHRGPTDAYVAKAIPDPATWLALLAAHNDSALLHTDVAVGDAQLATLAWPGDQQWSDFVADHIRRGIPGLEGAIGLPWPGASVDVVESVAPYIYGYGGWYTRADHRVEIGDELDPTVVIHELSHVWFNEDFVDSRWVDEGLAQEYASQVVAALGEPTVGPQPIDGGAPGAILLDDWASPDLKSSISEAQETFGYNASFTVIHAIASEIGADRMRAVIAATQARQIPYRGNPAPETVDGAADWRRFLDLLVEVGGSTTAEQLMRDHVANATDQAALDARTKARAAYAALAAAGAGWSPPLVIRREMSAWTFDAATADMAAATAVLADRDQIAATLAPLHLPVPAPLQAHYEAATDTATIASEAGRTLAAAQAVVAADGAVRRSVDPLGRIGLLGGAATRPLHDAKVALAAGRPDDAIAAAHRAERAVDDATRAGLLRIVAVVALVGLVLLLRRVRRARRRRPAAAAQEATGAEPAQAP